MDTIIAAARSISIVRRIVGEPCEPCDSGYKESPKWKGDIKAPEPVPDFSREKSAVATGLRGIKKEPWSMVLELNCDADPRTWKSPPASKKTEGKQKISTTPETYAKPKDHKTAIASKKQKGNSNSKPLKFETKPKWQRSALGTTKRNRERGNLMELELNTGPRNKKPEVRLHRRRLRIISSTRSLRQRYRQHSSLLTASSNSPNELKGAIFDVRIA